MKKYIYLALISAALLWLAWPPIPYTSPILLFAFVPLMVALQRLENDNSIIKKPFFLIAGLTFLVWNTTSIYWVFNSLNAVMPTIAACLLSLIPFGLGAFLMTLSLWIYCKIAKNARPFIADISLIGLWMSYEYLHQSWDLKFPWMTLGNGFATTPQLIQWYEFTGVYGGSLWILVSNILIFRIFQAKGERQKAEGKELNGKKSNIALISLAAWIIIPLSISVYMYSNYEEEINPSNVVVVQPNIDPYGKNYTYTAEQQLEVLLKLSKEKAQVNTEFFIWPETALVGFTEENSFLSSPNFKTTSHFLDSFRNATVITGAETYAVYQNKKTPSARLDKQNNIYWDSFNTAVAIENSPKLQFYHKSKLVPGVEKMPFPALLNILTPLFEKFGGSTGGYGAQEEPSNLYTASGIGVVPAICYESIWGDWVAKSVNQGAQFIAIITNDGWWGNTSGKDQHLDYARLRAVENRRWVARSANTGISAFINQRGDVVQHTEWWQPAVLKQDINLNSELTFYTKHQDWLVYPFLLIGFLSLIYWLFIQFLNKKKLGG